jgi:hypothetical protein
MKKRIVDPYTTRPIDLKAGDVMIRTVTCHVLPGPDEDTLAFRLYVCPYPHSEDIPQGTPAPGPSPDLARSLFPVLYGIRAVPDK